MTALLEPSRLTALLDPLRLQRTAPDEPREPRALHDWLIVLALLACYAAVQSAFVRPPQPSDALHYFFDGARLPATTWPAHQALRIGLTIPVWVLTRVLGYSEAAYYALPYLATAGLVVATYWLGRLLDSRAAGAIAGLLIVANPFVLDDSSILLPDLPAAALLTGAVTLLVWEWRRADGSTTLTRVDRAVLIAVGLMLGWAYLIREFIVFWYPVIALVILVLRLPRPWWRLVAAATAGVVAFELLWGLVFHGTPFARIQAALNQPPSQPWRVAQRERLIAEGVIPDTHREMLAAPVRAVVSTDAGWVLVVLFVALVVGAIVIRSPALRVLALWVVVPLVLLMCVIQAAWLVDNRILRAETIRYWLPAVPPLVVGGVIAIISLGRTRGSEFGKRMAIGAAAVLTAISLVLTGADLDRTGVYTRTGQDQYLEFREWASTSGQTCRIMWTDRDNWRASGRWVEMYLQSYWGRPVWDGEVRYINTGDEFLDIDDLETGALVRGDKIVRRRAFEGLALPDWLQRPPSSWRVLLTTNNGLVRVLAVGDSACARP